MGVKQWIQVWQTCNVDDLENIDKVTKFLLISRVCVLPMTLTSAIIGGLLAFIDGYLNITLFLLVIIGLTLAHMSNNMINDYFDYKHGVDTDEYIRAQYAPHPILSGLIKPKTFLALIFLVNIPDFLILLYLFLIRGLIVLIFALLGAFFSFFYVAPPFKFKHRGMGELSVFLVWGPLMIGGTYYVLTGFISLKTLLLSTPYGLLVTNVLVGKHVDKYFLDKEKGIKTLPVILGYEKSKNLVKILSIFTYLLIIILIISNFLTAWAFIVFISLPRLVTVWRIFSIDKPENAPIIPKIGGLKARIGLLNIDYIFKNESNEGVTWPIWPLWYVAWAFWLNKSIGFLFIVSLILEIFYPLDLSSLLKTFTTFF